MELYYTLGKSLLGIFIGLTQLISPTPGEVPDSQSIFIASSTPIEEIIVPISTTTKNIIISSSTEPTHSPTTPKQPQAKAIPIYLNYPEKIVISPVKSIEINFNRIFNYSLQQPIATIKIPAATASPIVNNYIPPKENSPITLPTSSNTSNEQRIKNSVVNIYCNIQNGRNIKVVTGSGVIIDPKGIILTNAHVGEYPLLQNSSIASNMTCSVRTGSPVNKTYGVKVLHISKDWINLNYRNISQTNFSETGENDIALLYIVDKTTGGSTGKNFDYIPLSTSAPAIGDQISIASYPADLLGSSGINALLTVQTEQLRVSDAFSFSYATQSDLIETSDSLQAQHGSSGGALLDSSNNLAGIIVITVNGNNPLLKHARALTVAHINNVVQKDTGKSLTSFTSQNPNDSLQQFESIKSSLIQRLIDGSAALFFQQ